MRILFITTDFTGSTLCRRLVDENNDVRALVVDPIYLNVLDGILPKYGVPTLALQSIHNSFDLLQEHLIWVGLTGLVIFDDSGYGQLQDELRCYGYPVIGGCAGADKLEYDRAFAQSVLLRHGINTLEFKHFDNAHDAITFLKNNRGRWVIKHNGNKDKTVCYAGRMESAEDVIDILNNAIRADEGNSGVALQRYAKGIEICVARYFNGLSWVGPIEYSIEHKLLFPSDLGPNTYEMGNLMWYDSSSTKLFDDLLNPLTGYLRKINFHGDIDINCIVNDEGVWPLEFTPRFGYPATALQIELHNSPWADFLMAVASGNNYQLDVSTDYAIAILVAAPPFPYKSTGIDSAWLGSSGLRIHFESIPSESELRHYHFEGAKLLKDGAWEICDDTGYIVHVTGKGRTIPDAQKSAVKRAQNLIIPRSFYRKDIGEAFHHYGLDKLISMGYLNEQR